MSKSRWLVASVTFVLLLLFGLSNLGLQATEIFNIKTSQSSKLFKEECGSCHLAYPAKLLPKESWTKIMGNLEEHFDENAELDTKTGQIITTYLVEHSSNGNAMRRLNNILRKSPKGIPLRITELPYFIRKHDEVSHAVVSAQSNLKAFNQCDKCHQEAENGDFDEGRVTIPDTMDWRA